MIKTATANAETFYYKFGIPHTCTYCGEYADTIDHCIPYSVLRNETRKKNKLLGFCCPACKECNCLLGNKVFTTFQERVLFVNRTLKKKYGAHRVVWDKEELEEISGNLKKYIQAENITFQISRDRILWINGNSFRKMIKEVEEDLESNFLIENELKKFFIDV